MRAGKNKAKKSRKRYDPKLKLDEKVGFDDLVNVAIKYDPKKKAIKKKKPKK
jgi:hypothetical protein